MTVLEVETSFFGLAPMDRRAFVLAQAEEARFLRTPEAFVVLRWDDVRALLRDKRFAGVGLSIFDMLGIGDGPLRRWYGSLMFTNEGWCSRSRCPPSCACPSRCSSPSRPRTCPG